MTKLKAKVMRIEANTVVVITEEGDFKRIPMPRVKPRLGETIEISLRPAWKFPILAAAAAILVVVLGLNLLKIWEPTPALASVVIDLKPSLQLVINKDNTVLEVKKLNREAQELLRDTELEGLDVYTAVDLITKQAVTLGYIKPDQKNLVFATVIVPDSAKKQFTLDSNKLRNVIHNKLTASKVSGYLVVNESPETLQKKAAAQGVSVNKYLLWEKLQTQGLKQPLESVKDKSIYQIVSDNDTVMDNILPGSWCSFGPGESQGTDTSAPDKTVAPDWPRYQRSKPKMTETQKGKTGSKVSPHVYDQRKSVPKDSVRMRNQCNWNQGDMSQQFERWDQEGWNPGIIPNQGMDWNKDFNRPQQDYYLDQEN
ncbi:MAG: anti-sigma factor domain-containing protein [Clostridia bacterium]|nr:anti-sigma factor domain-containing protein [Clostridia bacterium]